MKTLQNQSKNEITVIGKLLDMTVRTGKTGAGKDYESANYTIRVIQQYHGREETDDISMSTFATKFTNAGNLNPVWDSVQRLKEYKTVANYGEDGADTIAISGRSTGRIRENNFASRTSGQIINGWQLDCSFPVVNVASNSVASFNLDIFILDMFDEVDRDGEPTGRMKIKGGIVQYGEMLDVLEFVVEEPDEINHLRRSLEINNTVNVWGRIRITSVEEVTNDSEGASWGEMMPQTTTRMVRELVITGGFEPYEEDLAYDPAEIKRGFQARKARLEQLQMNTVSKSRPASQTTTANAPAPKSYAWEA